MLSAKVRICTKPKKEENILLFHGRACSKMQGKKLLAVRRHQVTTNQLPSDLHAPQDLERTPTVLPKMLSHGPWKDLTSPNSQTILSSFYCNSQGGCTTMCASQMTALHQSAELRKTRSIRTHCGLSVLRSHVEVGPVKLCSAVVKWRF